MKLSCLVVIIFVVASRGIAKNEVSRTYEHAKYQDKFRDLLTSIVDVNKKRLNVLKAYGQLANFNANSRGALRSKDNEDGAIVVLLNANNAGMAASHANFDTKDNKLFVFDEDDNVSSREDVTDLSKVLQYIKESVNDEPVNLIDGENVYNETDLAEESDNFIDLIQGTNDGVIETESDNIQDILRSNDDGKNAALRTLFGRSCMSRGFRQCRKVCKATLRRVCGRYACTNRIRSAFRYSCRGYCKKAFRYY